jgi:hypothetical protein
LWVRQGAYTRVEHLKGPSFRSALALFANIRLGWKGLPGTNTLAHYEKSVNYGCKKFYRIAPGFFAQARLGLHLIIKLRWKCVKQFVRFWVFSENCNPIMFYSTGSWGLYYITFYSHNLWIFIISWSVCLWKAFPT